MYATPVAKVNLPSWLRVNKRIFNLPSFDRPPPRVLRGRCVTAKQPRATGMEQQPTRRYSEILAWEAWKTADHGEAEESSTGERACAWYRSFAEPGGNHLHAGDQQITHQLESAGSCDTDAGTVHRIRAGHKSITLSVHTRCIHTMTESVQQKNAMAAVDLLPAYLSG
ncbi:MAG: hypothetical protein ACKVS9_05010 [Phycisphaerae bacterium]